MSYLLFIFILCIIKKSCSDFCYNERGECHSPHQFLLSNMSWSETIEKNYRLKIITVATEETDGFLRFMRSARHFDLDVEVHGMSEEWKKTNYGDDIGGGKVHFKCLLPVQGRVNP